MTDLLGDPVDTAVSAGLIDASGRKESWLVTAIQLAFSEGGAASLGCEYNLFHQGVAKETNEPEVVAATMAQPGVILRRPVGSDGPFRQHADLPTLSGDEVKDRPEKPRAPCHRYSSDRAKK